VRLLLLFIACLFKIAIVVAGVDYDYVFIGTSPIPMIEATYRAQTGARVLMLEAGHVVGGAWQAIDICHIHNVDMGCHQIGYDQQMRRFLETYIGCKLVAMNDPYGSGTTLHSSDNGAYFSHGCHELMTNLSHLAQASGVTILLDHKLQSIHLDFDREVAEIKTNNKSFTVAKLIVTPHSDIVIENFPNLPKPQYSKHPHLYLLVTDPTPMRFTYINGFCKGISRAINLTAFLPELEGTDQQLIAIQTHDTKCVTSASQFLAEFIKRDFLDPSAFIITAESYVYNQPHFNFCEIQNAHPNARLFFELLPTDAIWNLSQHIKKWEKVFTPFALSTR